MGKDKRGEGPEEAVGGWAIALGILVIIIIGYFILKKYGVGIVDYIQNLFRFGT